MFGIYTSVPNVNNTTSKQSSEACLLLRRFVFRTLVEDKGERETRVTGNEAQGTIRKGRREASRLFNLSSLQLRANLHQESDVWAAFTAISVTLSGSLCDEALEQYG